MHNMAFDREPNQQEGPSVKGFQELVFSVYKFEACISFYTEVLGYDLIYKGICNSGQKVFWELEDSVEIEEAVLQNTGDEDGFIRLVKFHNISQQQIRSSASSWDVGGIFDINIRTKDLAASFKEFQQAGWNGYSDPIRYQFGKFDVGEVIMRGHDGISIAMMQRHAPPLEGYPHMRTFSKVFNSSHISKDIEATADFFLNKLGWQVYMKVAGTNRKAVRNILGVPKNVNEEIELPIYIVHPTGGNIGSLEFLQFKGIEGDDFSTLAVPPNLGILMARFPVSDAEAYQSLLISRGLEPKVALNTFDLAPYGRVKGFVIQSPDGVWMEFLELLKE